MSTHTTEIQSCIPNDVSRKAFRNVFRIVSWNIHKGVMGIGWRRKLRIHALAEAVASLDADVVCLQEVRHFNKREQLFFQDWPSVCQSQVLAPENYTAVYRTNAVTKYGEHGNALLSRHAVLSVHHQDVSDHKLEQRGLLHVKLDCAGGVVHVVVLHLGLIHGSRIRQMAQVKRYIQHAVPADEQLFVAGDFNTNVVAKKWARGQMNLHVPLRSVPTFPARLPVLQLDHVFWRFGSLCHVENKQNALWSRLSDHLPLVLDICWK